MIPVVLVYVSKQKEKALRLKSYCKALDGTIIDLMTVDYKTEMVAPPEGATLTLYKAAEKYHDTPFIWLETDAIPLKAGWAEAITKEYEASGKQYLLPTLEGCSEYDVASGIGIYPAGCRAEIPLRHERYGWDYYIYSKLTSKVHFTRRIQHFYGFYGTHGRIIRKAYFPKDRYLIRPDTMVFHTDPTQSLIWAGEQSFYHTGDMGDIVAFLPVMRGMGGGKLYIGPKGATRCREDMNGARFDSIKSLLADVPWVTSVEWKNDPDGVTHNVSSFRASKIIFGESLAHWQARHLGLPNLDMSPWLTSQAAPHGRAIAARSMRYRNLIFPWKGIADTFGDRLLFVGTDEEHADFETQVGRPVEKANTPTLADVRDVIAGASIVFCNQSCPFWIAAGLGKRLVQETQPKNPNSYVKYAGADYIDSITQVTRLLHGLKKYREKGIVPSSAEPQEQPADNNS